MDYSTFNTEQKRSIKKGICIKDAIVNYKINNITG
jgi:hypothetical protein